MKRTIFTADHEEFRALAERFITHEAVPHATEWEENGMVERSFWLKAAALGLVGFMAPERYGGLGLRDFRYNAILSEQMAYAGAVGDNFSLQNDILAPYLVDATSPAQQERWLSGFTRGELIAAIAMSEPAAGSDLRSIQTHARRTDAGYVLNGSKTFVTSGVQADLVIVAAQLRKHSTANGLTLFAVEAGTPGFEKAKKLRKIGRLAQDTAELFLTDVEIPVENRIGDEGDGLRLLKENLAQERLSIAVTAVAAATAAVQMTEAYCLERRTFGRPIIEHQSVRFAIADARVRLDMAQAYLDHGLLAHVKGELSAVDAAALKLATTEMQFDVADVCLQLHGGYGYMEEYPIARNWRDARAQRIYGGTNEIMKDIVGRSVNH